MIKLSKWAKLHGYSYSGAYNLFKTGKMPVKCIQLQTGTIMVEEDGKTSCKVVNEKGESFVLEWDRDINTCNLSGIDQREVLDEMNRLVDLIINKLNFGVNIKKTWRP